MTGNLEEEWKAISDLVEEMKRCSDADIPVAAVAMAFICIDALANLSRPKDRARVTRSDFKLWVDKYLKAHPSQIYQYKGKDVYAARCSFLHTYGSEAELHKENDTIKFTYHDGGKHEYIPDDKNGFVVIGIESFINDTALAVDSFLVQCSSDLSLNSLVKDRLSKMFICRSH